MYITIFEYWVLLDHRRPTFGPDNGHLQRDSRPQIEIGMKAGVLGEDEYLYQTPILPREGIFWIIIEKRGQGAE